MSEYRPLLEIIVLGILAYFIDVYAPMNDVFKFVFRVVVFIVAFVLLVRFLSSYM